MTDEQKREMYRKCTKEQLIGFLIEREKKDIVCKNDTCTYIPQPNYQISTT